MGSDNLHHKNRQASIKSLERKIKNRAQHDVVLIVCEGEKTEPNYLKDLREELQLNRANIKIVNCPNGTDPLNIVNYAIDQFNQYQDYDRVHCVFDKEHTNYQAAINKAQSNISKKNGMPLYIITSVPCFEYWILLHFKDTSKPYKQIGSKTPSEQLVKEIKVHIPNYCKGHLKIFEKTKHLLNTAITRAKRIDELQQQNGTDNPSTKVYQLVEYLRGIQR